MSSAAKAIKCEQCKTVFLNVNEVQTHADSTGHNQFSETDETPLVFYCQECGKPCRSETEKDFHSRRTGHSEFSLTELQNKIDTAAQAKELKEQKKQEMEEELESITGKRPKHQHKQENTNNEETVEPEIDQSLLNQMMEMGFTRNQSIRAIYENETLERSVDWLAEHLQDDDIDEPLLVPKSKAGPRVPLTEEEKARKIEELRILNKARREKEEKEEQRKREKERIESGKKISEMKREADDIIKQRERELRKREKEADIAAKQAMKEMLQREREERLRQAGIDPKAQQNSSTEATTSSSSSSVPTPKPKPLDSSKKEVVRQAVVHVKKNVTNEQIRQTALQTLQIYVTNILKNSDDEKFRTIKLTNKAFQSRVACADGATKVLESIGFVLTGNGEEEHFFMARDQVDPLLLQQTAQYINDALTNPYFGIL